MTAFTLNARVYTQLEDIYDYTRDKWGDDPADAYIASLFDAFDDIAQRRETWRRIDAALGIYGYRHPHRSHVIYWRAGKDGQVFIATVLHQRMLPEDRLHESFADLDAD